MPPHRSFATVLVANRGEIAIRIFRTLATRGMRAIGVYTPADSGALHVRRADLAVEVGSYLDTGALVAAAKASGAEAVHPGYGFLSEDPAFARAVVGAGLVWVGPPPDAIEAMGDKIRAKQLVAAAGVPVVPGAGRPGITDADLAEAATAVGLPVLLKPSAGGGGKGMRRVSEPAELLAAIAAARREAASAFGDDTMLVERWITRPRHVEVQVFADAHGRAVHLGERECSLQRRHQKIVEESPSPLLDDATRRSMTKSALDASRACGYVGAGTVEFVVSADRPEEFFFMEMNTRLQVEHPVTEAVTGIDLVDWQLRVAAGEPLPLAQDEVRFAGHAVEARIYAEDPGRGFLPSSGRVVRLVEATDREGVRVDSALCEGLEVGTGYDPMLAKVVAWGPDRPQALARLRGALESTAVLGLGTNIGHLVALLGHPDVVSGRLDTELVERTAPELTSPDALVDTEAAVVAACRLVRDLEPGGPVVDPWDIPDGWRIGDAAPTRVELCHDGHTREVTVRGRTADALVRAGDGAPAAVSVVPSPDCAGDLVVAIDGSTSRWTTAVAGDDVWVGRDGRAWRFAADRAARGERTRRRAAGGSLTSPMPGLVVAVHVSAGERVRAGQPVVSVEAMKMEHAVVAPADGVVDEVLVAVGQTVTLDGPLAELTLGDTAGVTARGRAADGAAGDDGAAADEQGPGGSDD